MSDLGKYINERKKRDKKFAAGYEEGYEQFKIGITLRQAREASVPTIMDQILLCTIRKSHNL